MDSTSIIGSVKMELFRKSELPPDSQRLIFAGKQLEDQYTLEDYNIEDQNTLVLIARIRG
jgi:hypothetical protein